jgi:tetratricopeptide (TPR) repeat protein
MHPSRLLPAASLRECWPWACSVAAGAARADDYADVTELHARRPAARGHGQGRAVPGHQAARPADAFSQGRDPAGLRQAGRRHRHLHQADQDYPELPEPYNNLAVLYAGQGQFDKARAALEMAIRTNPSYATAHENLGDVYAKLASQAYSKALQLDSNNTGVQPKLALIRDLFAPGAKGQKPHRGPAAAAPAPAPVAVANRPRAGTGPSRPCPRARARTVRPPPPRRRSAKDVEAAVGLGQCLGSQGHGRLPGRLWQGIRPPGNQDRKAWEEDRRARIVGKSRISVQAQRPGSLGQGQQGHGQIPPGLRADTA